MSQRELIHSYRHILRNLIRGVNYAGKARAVAVKQLRAAYRDPNGVYDAEGVKRTVWFLKAAARNNGIEHKILKNLIEVRRINEEKYSDWRASLRKETRTSYVTFYLSGDVLTLADPGRSTKTRHSSITT